MKENIKTKKFFISFAISAIIFSLSAIIIGCGIFIGQRSEYTEKEKNKLDLGGHSFNFLIALCDYMPEVFDDYNSEWLKNSTGVASSVPTSSPSSPLVGYRKVYIENMAILRFDKERGEMSIIPVPGATLVNVKGLQVRLEEVAGRWGIDMLIQKIHSITGLEIDHYAVFTPYSASKALDLFGTVDYTIKCNMKYSVPDRGINIDLSAGTYRLDGATTVEMIRFRGYEGAGVTRGEIMLGYIKRLMKKVEQDFTKEEIRVIIGEVLAKTYSDVNVSDLREEIDLAVDFNKLSFEFVELCGNWQTVNGEHYFVHDETKTLNKLSKYRKQVP